MGLFAGDLSLWGVRGPGATLVTGKDVRAAVVAKIGQPQVHDCFAAYCQ